MEPTTIDELMTEARAAYDALTSLGEDVEDEWSYVNDLASAWTDRLDAVAAARGHEPAGPAIVAGVAALVGEARLIDDPHRAIDWLSTFPQVLLIAIGERP